MELMKNIIQKREELEQVHTNLVLVLATHGPNLSVLPIEQIPNECQILAKACDSYRRAVILYHNAVADKLNRRTNIVQFQS